jgi:hypothetical protein
VGLFAKFELDGCWVGSEDLVVSGTCGVAGRCEAGRNIEPLSEGGGLIEALDGPRARPPRPSVLTDADVAKDNLSSTEVGRARARAGGGISGVAAREALEGLRDLGFDAEAVDLDGEGMRAMFCTLDREEGVPLRAF